MSELVGQELEAYCGKCKEDTLHLVTSADDDKIEKVMCKTCMSYHKFKKPATEQIASQPKKKPLIKKVTRTRRSKWTRILDDSDVAAAVTYEMGKTYDVETTIHHKTFGLGVVKNILDSQKIEVLFVDGEKILVQNYHP